MQPDLSYELSDAELANVSGGENIVFGIGGGVTIVMQTGGGLVPRIWVCDATHCVDTKGVHNKT
jgi:bacteriocin-like protein